MGILDLARRDLQRITTDAAAGFAVPVQFTAPGLPPVTVNALTKRHHFKFDFSEGVATNTLVASVSVSEAVLTLAGYPVRDTPQGPVRMVEHLVSVADSNGTLIPYVIKETWPDETLGLIVCTLGEYEP